MADSTREGALKALKTVLDGIDWTGSTPDVTRNEPEDSDIPSGGRVNLLDGDPGEPVEVYLSPIGYAYEHAVLITVAVLHRDAATRDSRLDALLRDIGAAIAADPTLGDTVDEATPIAPEPIDTATEGAATIKAVVLPVVLEYVTSNPLT